MTKRSRKTAFGKANVVRRSSLKTIPGYVRDPLSLDRPALRKNVRTTLLLGTALGASLMAVSLYSDPAFAVATTVCSATIPVVVTGASPTPTETFSGGAQTTGIHCDTTEDPTIVVTNTSINGDGANAIVAPASVPPFNANDGSGIQIQDIPQAGSPNNLSVNLTVSGGVIIGTVGAPITKDGIEVTIDDKAPALIVNAATDTININNSDTIGAPGNKVGVSGIFAKTTTYALETDVVGVSATGGSPTAIANVTNSGKIYSAAGDGIYSGAVANGSNVTVEPAGAGGKATASVAITNSAYVYSTAANALNGVTTATAIGTASTGAGTGGNAGATTIITNTAATLNPGLAGINGAATATANGVSATGTGAGGTAAAVVTISNTGTIASIPLAVGSKGINGNSIANATGSGASGTGGSATATTSITNAGPIGVGTPSTLALTGITGFATGNTNATATGVAGTATGGTSKGTVGINNNAAVTSPGNAVFGQSVATSNATATATGIAKGGNATAGTSIANGAAGAINSTAGFGLYGYSGAQAIALVGKTSTGGVANATTSITNAATITSFNEGIDGQSKASANAFGQNVAGSVATAGTATSGVVITNANTIKSTNSEGIEGVTVVNANAGTFGARSFTATGGTANATTTETNATAGTITSKGNGMEGFATATADAFGSNNAKTATTAAGKGTAGTANATVKMYNNATITTYTAIGMLGVSFAGPSGFGYTAIGGIGNAQTTMTNAGSIYAFLGGVAGTAIAIDDAFAPVTVPTSGGPGSSATGGTSTANVLVSNTGAISTKYGVDLFGFTLADASAFGGFTAKGGTSTATTTITNSKSLTAYDGVGIFGTSAATAVAISSLTTKGVTATGGAATATTSITNGGNIYAGSEGLLGIVFGGDGIIGLSAAAATAVGTYKATGGTAIATTSITNGGNLSVYGNFLSPILGFIPLLGGDGIDALAVSEASGIASLASPVVGSKKYNVGTGGTAISTVQINSTGTTINSHYGNGILGATLASANGVGFHAYGGRATATTNIANTANINSDAGIYGFAVALALGIGSPLADPGKATGGTATATVSIGNAGNINSTFPVGPGGGFGILGSSIAVAGAVARQATGGTATANTTISNSGTIRSQNDGINGSAFALADGIGVYGIKGLAKGGAANATVNITNTGPNIYSLGGYGIIGTTFASASGITFLGFGNGTGGNATANTTIVSNGKIVTYGGGNDALHGASTAFAIGSKTGGTATANTNITNNNVTNANGVTNNPRSIYTTAAGAVGIYGSSYTNADGGTQGGTANSTTTLNNNGSILTLGVGSFGMQANSTAHADSLLQVLPGVLGGNGGTATANSSATNSSNIVTRGNGAIGVLATSAATAYGVGGTATANSTVVNANTTNIGPADITTYGNGAAGIVAASTATAGTYFTGAATAKTNVTNNGSVNTNGVFSAGIVSLATAFSGSGSSSLAGSYVTNTGGIVTTGPFSAGVFAATLAAGYYGPGSSAGKATANTTVINTGLVDTGGFFSAGLFGASAAQGYYTATANTQITNSGGITTGGNLSPGIFATSFALDTGLNANATATTNVLNSNKILTTGNFSDGIDAFSTALGDPTANTTVTNNVSIITKGANSYGVNATSFTNANTGNANSTTAVTNGPNAVISTYGNYSTGVFGAATALATVGTANATTTVVNSAGASITTAGNFAYGVYLSNYARALGNATAKVDVTNAGTIATSGPGAVGVLLYAGAFAAKAGSVALATATVTNSGTIATSGPGAAAIQATVFGDSSIAVTNLNGGVIKATGAPYTAIMATVKGTIVGSTIGIANNAGATIQGNLQLSGGTDTLVNAGSWIMQGNSNFGPGKNDSVTNSGTVSMLNGGAAYTGNGAGRYANGPVLGNKYGPFFGSYTITVSGLENFTNAGGVVTMANGYENQQIVLSGNFIGTGNSRLAVDAFLGAPGSTADILVVGGTTSGTTHIIVNDTNPGFGAYNPVGIPVVVVGGSLVVVGNGFAIVDPKTGLPSTHIGDFDLPQGPISKGLFDYDLYLNANKNVWVLASTPNAVANELPRLMTAVQDIWHEAAGVWADRSADLRAYYAKPQVACDPRLVTKAPCLAPAPSGVGPGAWARAFGDWSHNDGSVDETLFGKTHSYDVSYHQNIYGLQAGLDFSAQRMGYENFIFGLLAGGISSKVDFASGTTARFDGGNIGAYATYLNRGFFSDWLVLANIVNVNYNHTTLINSLGTAFSVGGHVDMGYRFAFQNNWFMEPLATVEAVYTEFRHLNLPDVYANLNNLHTRGRLGVRVGTEFMSGGYRIEPSLTGSVWHSFTEDNIAEFTSGAFTLDLADVNPHRTYGEIGGAVNVFDPATRWNGFVKGDFRFASDYYGGSVKAGVRYNW